MGPRRVSGKALLEYVEGCVNSIRQHIVYSKPVSKPECPPCSDARVVFAVQRRPKSVYLWEIIERTCKRTGVAVSEIKSGRRFKRISHTRFMIIWLARHLTNASYPKIARAVGVYNHTSAKHGFRRAIELREQCEHYRKACDDLRAKLSEEFMG